MNDTGDVCGPARIIPPHKTGNFQPPLVGGPKPVRSKAALRLQVILGPLDNLQPSMVALRWVARAD